MTYKDSLQNFEDWDLHYVWRWWGVRLNDGRKVRGCHVMRRRVSGAWQYREVAQWDLPRGVFFVNLDGKTVRV